MSEKAMTKEVFTSYMKSLVSKAAKVRGEKEEEYFSRGDVLRNFRKIGEFRGDETPRTIMNLWAKTLQSISDTVNEIEDTPDPPKLEKWDEKFVDAVNYLFKLYASIRETL